MLKKRHISEDGVFSESHTPSSGYLNRTICHQHFFMSKVAVTATEPEDSAVPSFRTLLHYRAFVIITLFTASEQKHCGSNLVAFSIAIVFAEIVGKSARVKKHIKNQMAPSWLRCRALTGKHNGTLLTLPTSTSFVIMTMLKQFSCHTILQKSYSVSCLGPEGEEGRERKRKGRNRKKQTEATTALRSAVY